jgi:hypothetical protein
MGAFFYCPIGEARRERERERVGAAWILVGRLALSEWGWCVAGLSVVAAAFGWLVGVAPSGWLVVRCCFSAVWRVLAGRRCAVSRLCAWAWGSPLLGSLPLLFFPLAARLVSAPWLRCAVWGCLFAALLGCCCSRVAALTFPRLCFLPIFIIACRSCFINLFLRVGRDKIKLLSSGFSMLSAIFSRFSAFGFSGSRSGVSASVLSSVVGFVPPGSAVFVGCANIYQTNNLTQQQQ